MSDKPLTEMTTEEILQEISDLRDRRARAREARATEKANKSNKTPIEKKGSEEVTGELSDLLGDILGE